MRVETLGEGGPEYTVVGSIHGDEPCGKEAIERFLSKDWDVKKPVKLIIANEEALEENQRFLDTDLNRAFPGDPESEKHEERLAAKILEEVEGTKILDLHSTRSYPEPFGTFTFLTESVLKLLRSAGVQKAVHFPEEGGTMHEKVDAGVIVEAGYQGTEEAAENAYHVLKNFLASEGVIDAEFERSNPEIFRYQETVEGAGWEFMAENFELVEKGQVFARRGDEELEAQEDFYPVMMSTAGYEDILGFKARKVET